MVIYCGVFVNPRKCRQYLRVPVKCLPVKNSALDPDWSIDFLQCVVPQKIQYFYFTDIKLTNLLSYHLHY